MYITVPDGAIQKGCKEEMFLAVLREDNDRLKLAGTITLQFCLVASWLLTLEILIVSTLSKPITFPDVAIFISINAKVVLKVNLHQEVWSVKIYEGPAGDC